MTKSHRLLLALFALTTFFVCNWALPTDIMESRNLVTAREMAEEGHWLVPTMNGELRLAKPPLPTWVAGVIETVRPDSLGAQRTAAGIMGLLWTVFLFLTVKQLSKRQDFALLTALVFMTSYQTVLMSRVATWDIYCHALMMGAIYFLVRGLTPPDVKSGDTLRQSGAKHSEGKRVWLYLPLAGLMMGLSFLSKGPVSFFALLLPFLIGWVTFFRPSLKGRWLPLIAMVFICAAVSSWWYAYLFIFQPISAHAAVHGESTAWASHNVRPWYYYWRFFSETGVWAVVMLAALAIPYWKKNLTDKRTYLTAILWTLATIFFLSLMPEKKIRYLLPVMAPCAMSVACLLEHFREKRDSLSRVTFRTSGYVVGLVILAMPAILFFVLHVAILKAIVLSILFVLLAAVLIRATWKWKVGTFVVAVCLVFALTECTLLGEVGSAFGITPKHGIGLTRNNPALKQYTFYYPADEPLRIEEVYQAHRKIPALQTNNAKDVMDRLPFVLVSDKPISSELPAAVLKDIDTTYIGTYDDNVHPRTSRRYNPLFVKKLTILKKRQHNEPN